MSDERPASRPGDNSGRAATIVGLDTCAVHKHSPTYGDHVCAHCGRFIPDASKVITAYHRAVQEAQGCTELTCIYHGRINSVRRDLEHIQRVMGWSS